MEKKEIKKQNAITENLKTNKTELGNFFFRQDGRAAMRPAADRHRGVRLPLLAFRIRTMPWKKMIAEGDEKKSWLEANVV